MLDSRIEVQRRLKSSNRRAEHCRKAVFPAPELRFTPIPAAGAMPILCTGRRFPPAHSQMGDLQFLLRHRRSGRARTVVPGDRRIRVTSSSCSFRETHSFRSGISSRTKKVFSSLTESMRISPSLSTPMASRTHQVGNPRTPARLSGGASMIEHSSVRTSAADFRINTDRDGSNPFHDT